MKKRLSKLQVETWCYMKLKNQKIPKPKNITTKELMNAIIEKRKEKRNEKKLLLEKKLAQNTEKTNKLKNGNKKRKLFL